MSDKNLIVVKTYTGNLEEATRKFNEDSSKMAAQGFFPTSQSWAPGTYGCGAFLLALLLCVVLIGILIFIYMLIVKPAGTLSVTYEFRDVESATSRRSCPNCAESIMRNAKFCRFCNTTIKPKYVDDENANDQIIKIIQMSAAQKGAEQIANELNSNGELYLADKSSWTSAKVQQIIKTFSE